MWYLASHTGIPNGGAVLKETKEDVRVFEGYIEDQ